MTSADYDWWWIFYSFASFHYCIFTLPWFRQAYAVNGKLWSMGMQPKLSLLHFHTSVILLSLHCCHWAVKMRLRKCAWAGWTPRQIHRKYFHSPKVTSCSQSLTVLGDDNTHKSGWICLTAATSLSHATSVQLWWHIQKRSTMLVLVVVMSGEKEKKKVSRNYSNIFLLCVEIWVNMHSTLRIHQKKESSCVSHINTQSSFCVATGGEKNHFVLFFWFMHFIMFVRTVAILQNRNSVMLSVAAKNCFQAAVASLS